VDRLVREGLAHHRAGRLKQAEALYLDALRRDPRDARALCLLGNLYGETGRAGAALEAFGRAVAAAPNLAEAHNGLGMVHAGRGEAGPAEACFRKAIAIEPGGAQGFFNLGVLCLGTARVNEAVGALKRAVALAPGHGPARAALAEVLAGQGDVAEGLDMARRAAALAPDDPEVQRRMGRVLGAAARWDEALACYDRALAARPGDPVAAVGKATVLADRGEAEAAHGLLEPLVAGERPVPRAAVAFAALARRVRREGEALAAVERALAAEGLTEADRRDLCYAAGLLLDAGKDYDAAFARYAEANRLAAVPFDPEAQTREVDRLMAAFDAARMGAAPRATERSDLPVFVVGMPRSGTTLVEQILASHPRAHGAGELHDAGRMAASLPGLLKTATPYPECAAELTGEALDTLARWYLGRRRSEAPDADRVVDKMPHNFLHLGLIALCLPGARVIHCARDPVDTCLSCHFQNFTSGGHPYTHDLAALGRYYRDYRRLMAHWEGVVGLPIHTVRYEALVDDPEGASRDLVAFLGLDWDPACLRFFASGRLVRTASRDQVRRPVYGSSAGRWRRYAAHLGPLLAALGPELAPGGGAEG
jgi:Flp pilus assembly protein TadD